MLPAQVERVTGRWIHPASGRSYHVKFAPPKTPGERMRGVSPRINLGPLSLLHGQEQAADAIAACPADPLPAGVHL